MFFADFLPPNPGVALMNVSGRLGIAAVAVPLVWGLLMYCFQLAVSQCSKQTLANAGRAEKTGVLGIVFAILSSLTAVFLLPKLCTDTILVTNVIMWYHRFGIALLGDFLLLALFFQLQYMLQSKKWTDLRQARALFTKWRWITETMPGPSAIIILFTGLERVAAVPGYSINEGWILFLVAILAVMMADGIFSYTPSIRDLADRSENSRDIHAFLRNSKNRLRDFKLFIHSLSFPIVLAFPVWRIGSHLNAAKPIFDKLHLDQTQGGWKQLIPAIVLFTALFVIIATVNRWGRKEHGKLQYRGN